MPAAATLTRRLPEPAPEERLELWPVADHRLRPQGFLVDLDPAVAERATALGHVLGRFAGRWHSLTGRRPELHLRLDGDRALPAALALDGRWSAVVCWHGHRAQVLGGAGGDEGPRRVDLGALRTARRGELHGRVLVAGVDDPAAMRTVRRHRVWRLVGDAVGRPDTFEGWCWWAAGLTLGERPCLRRSGRSAVR